MGLAIGGILKSARLWCFKTSSVHFLFLHLGFLAKTWLKHLSRVIQYQTYHLSLSVQHNIVIFWKINKRTNASFRHKKTSSPTQVVSKTESLSLLCQRSQEGGDPNPNLNRRIGHLLEILWSDPALWTPLKITLGDKVAVSKIGWYQFDISYGYSFPLTHVLQLLEVNGVVRQKSGRLNPPREIGDKMVVHLQTSGSKIPALSSNSVSLVGTNLLFRVTNESDSKLVVTYYQSGFKMT